MAVTTDSLSLSTADPFAHAMETHRRELTGYSYRMLGAGSEADDAVQGTFLRAWRPRDGCERRATLRSWLYRIAINVCLDMPQRPQRRARLAFVAALQHLPPRQRVVLILREVLHWHAAEVAELLDTSVASVNSALQRARATLDRLELESDETALDADDEELLARYVAAFQAYDIETFVGLLREDAAFSMPPHALWLRGPLEVSRWMLGPGIGCRGSHLIATRANGCPAFAQYKPDPEGGHAPWSIQVVELKGGTVTAIHNYLNTELFAEFGLPPHLDS